MWLRAPLLLAVLLLAACGGSSNSSSSDPGSKNYRPAQTTLKKAGLESCSQATRDLPSGLTTLPGLGATKGFYVAKACNGAKTTPNSVIVFQFTSIDNANSGAMAI